MKIEKVLNHNVVIAFNDCGQEQVVMGRGLAFQKKTGDIIDSTKVEKTFILEKDGVSDKLATLLGETSELYLAIAAKILDHARSQLSYTLDDYLYVALTDHISFAIRRHKENIQLKNPLLWEIRKYYKSEYQVALKALKIIKRDTGVDFPEDEAASIALHLVNSAMSGGNLEMAVQVTELVNDVLNIVKYHYEMELDESSINYERFITHLRFFAVRYSRMEEQYTSDEDYFLYDQIKIKYPEAFVCTQKIKAYLNKSLNWDISKDEETYLILHIHRVTKRQTDQTMDS
ncbi:BglG family transcription antiterminator LicT [Alkalihalobacillus sp. NPDC078783]